MINFTLGAFAMLGMVCFVADAMTDHPASAVLVAVAVVCAGYQAHRRVRRSARMRALQHRHAQRMQALLDSAAEAVCYFYGDPAGKHPDHFCHQLKAAHAELTKDFEELNRMGHR